MAPLLRNVSDRQVRTGYFLLDLSLLLCLIGIAVVLFMEPQGARARPRGRADRLARPSLMTAP